MRVTVDDSQCRGHGVCVALCPEVFTLTDGGYAVADPGDIAPQLQDAVGQAIQNCPEQAITAEG